MYRQFGVLHNPVMLRCLTSWRRLQDVDVCLAVNVCFGVCHPKLHDSPWLWREVCNRAWLFPFWVTCLSFHLLATPPPSTHLSFPWESALCWDYMQKYLQMFKHLLTIFIWLWCCEISKSPLKESLMESRCSVWFTCLCRPSNIHSAHDFSAKWIQCKSGQKEQLNCHLKWWLLLTRDPKNTLLVILASKLLHVRKIQLIGVALLHVKITLKMTSWIL